MRSLRDFRHVVGGRRGFVLILVILMALVTGVMVYIFQDAVIRESQGTHRLVRAIRAEIVADSVVTQIAAVLHQDPWEDRFYRPRPAEGGEDAAGAGAATPAAEWPFNHRSFPFHETDPGFEDGTLGYVGSVKDVSPAEQRYRVRVMVLVEGEEFLMVYDMRHAHGLLGPLNRDPVVQRTFLAEDTPIDLVDARVDAIWKAALLPENRVGDPADVPLARRLPARVREDAFFEARRDPPPPPPGIASTSRARTEAAPVAGDLTRPVVAGMANPGSLRPPPAWRAPESLAREPKSTREKRKRRADPEPEPEPGSSNPFLRMLREAERKADEVGGPAGDAASSMLDSIRGAAGGGSSSRPEAPTGRTRGGGRSTGTTAGARTGGNPVLRGAGK